MPDDKNLIGGKLNQPESLEIKNFESNRRERETIETYRAGTENLPENAIEKDSQNFNQIEGASGPEISSGIIAATKTSQKQKADEAKIEKILETGLEDVYKKLPAQKQLEFRVVGERTAKEINFLLNKAKFSVVRILDLIKKWLLIIPGMNNFFIEQEAKIKADQIIKIKNNENNL